MNKDAVLVDSSVWIHYLRRDGRQGIREALANALAKGRVTTCWVVKSELLVGTRNDAGFRKLDKLLNALPEIPIDAAVWKEAARLGTDLRRHGMTVPLPDLLIAEAAIQADIELWHTDDHFEEITKLVTLRAKNLLRAD
jgi:predicted nucleic acid-binding protein